MSGTKKYKVTQKGCLKYAVGDVVELTDKQARSLVNKVEIINQAKAEIATEKKSKGSKSKASL